MHAKLFHSTPEVATFIFAGKAFFTLLSLATDTRFTYRIVAKERSDGVTIHYVSVLTGTDNTNDYSYLGIVYPNGHFGHSGCSKIGVDAPSAKAFAWFYRFIQAGRPLPGSLQVWSEGRCGRCGHRLTSKWALVGFGADCAEHVGVALAKAAA